MKMEAVGSDLVRLTFYFSAAAADTMQAMTFRPKRVRLRWCVAIHGIGGVYLVHCIASMPNKSEAKFELPTLYRELELNCFRPASHFTRFLSKKKTCLCTGWLTI